HFEELIQQLAHGEDLITADVVSLAGNAFVHEQDVRASDVANVHDDALAGKRADLDDRLLKSLEDPHDLIDVRGNREAAAAARPGVGEGPGNEKAQLLGGGALADVQVRGSFADGVGIDRADRKTFVDGPFGFERRTVNLRGRAEHHARLWRNSPDGFREVDGARGVGEESTPGVSEAGRRMALRA